MLQGWLGREIEVSAHGGDGADPWSRSASGDACEAQREIGGARGVATGESFLFVIENGAGGQAGSFMLYEGCFGGARWLNDEGEALEVRSGVVRVLEAPSSTSSLSGRV